MPRSGTPPEYEWGALDERVVRQIRRLDVGARAQEDPPQERARPGRRVPRFALAGIAVAAILIVALVSLSPWSGDATTIPPISALEAPPTVESERIASLVATSGQLEGVGIRTDAMRELVSGPSGAGYLAPASGGAICVFYSAGQGIAGSSCGARERLATAPIGIEVQEGSRLIFVGLAPDGYTVAQLGENHAPVEGNGFLIEGTNGPGLIEVLGLGLPDLQTPIGEPRSR